ncbi:MAG: hypothetical protein S4CHLAM81_05630 [Chlamydiales bacterium]|nr:hypothetical protein [Chlamydiales bacterium]MCH9635348.1 hypothetical protein [Chlamydiales bacterium]MCH9704057.1 hypothetical protein [Chlamydiota bacterium]
MACTFCGTQLAGCNLEKAHWSTKIYMTVGVVSTVAFAALLYLTMQRNSSLFPYTICTGTAALLSIPAACLINKYYINKQLSDISDSIGQTTGALDLTAAAIDQEGDDLQAIINQMEAQLEERGRQVDELTNNLESVEERLRQSEAQLTATFDATRDDIQEVITLLGEEDEDIQAQVQRLTQLTQSTERMQTLTSLMKQLIVKMRAMMEVVNTSDKMDDTWDQNTKELKASATMGQQATEQLIQKAEEKMQELLTQADYIKVGKLLEKEDKPRYTALLKKGITDGD